LSPDSRFRSALGGQKYHKLWENEEPNEKIVKNFHFSLLFTCHITFDRYSLRPMPGPSGTSKTRKAVAKRFKITGTGKVLRRKQGARHILQKKSSKRKRALGRAGLVSDADIKNVKENLPFG
jgi:large subunit ribosomal protein L35